MAFVTGEMGEIGMRITVLDGTIDFVKQKESKPKEWLMST